MSQRVYLYAHTDGDDPELFAASNYLPFFWLTLLDAEALRACRRWWLEAEALWQQNEWEQEKFWDVWPPLTAVDLDRAELHHSAARTQRYLCQYQPALLPAHAQFVAYLHTQLPGEDDYLMLQIDALAAFSSAEAYLADLLAQVAALDQLLPWPHPLPSEPAELVGFASKAIVAATFPLLPQRPPPPPAPGWVATRRGPATTNAAPARERPDAPFLLLAAALFIGGNALAGWLVWQRKSYGFPLPFYFPARPHYLLTALGAFSLAFDLALTALLAWFLRGFATALAELLRHLRPR